ncbi:MAG: carboxypeptidase regulatory-like domain-containing protein [Terriglobia bacterium]
MRIQLAVIRWIAVSALLLPLASASLFAQAGAGTLRGRVTDPSGAAIVGIAVSVSSARVHTTTTVTNQTGTYEFKGLPAGKYTVKVAAPGFSVFQKQDIVVTAGHTESLNIPLQIEQQLQQVTVSSQATHISVSPENNASAVVITGKALEALSNDPDELQEELSALAGPAAGPNGGQIYIDGFTGGQLPPKSDILAIHVNQNPFSAQYSDVGYGRIEIITKPGSSQYHGSVFADGNDSAFNSRNPFVTQEPPYHSEFFFGNIGGPLGKKASFFFDTFRRSINDSSIVNAVVLNPTTFQQTPFNQAILHPQTRLMVTPRIDYQISPKNVLTVRYQLWKDSGVNNGIGQFNLASQGYSTHGAENTVQIGDTEIVSARTVNQTRFEYRYGTNNQTANSFAPALNVLGAFTDGGNAIGKGGDTMQTYELRNLTTMSLGKHTILFGGRFRQWLDSNTSTSNFNGIFTFPTLDAYQITEQGLAQGLTPAEIRAQGGMPSQFSIAAGTPLAKVSLADLGLYGEDQWRVRPNISLSLGLRFESQTDIHDHADFAPRLGFAWGLGGGKSSKTVLRAGFGLFYNRFEYAQVLQAERLNGVNQQRYLITNPGFFPTPPAASELASMVGAATTPTVYNIDPSLRAPYTIQSAVGLERQVSKNITASVTYLNSHGVHMLMTRNVNTPLPGAYDPANPAFGRPFANVSACAVAPAVPDCAAGFAGNIFQFESGGLYNQNELISNFRVNERYVTLFGVYTLNYADSNTDGVGSNPSNPYDLMQDYGRAAFDVRHRVFLGGAVNLPYGFRLMPFMHAESGDPYDITLGRDLLGTSIFNQRPAFAAPGATGPNIVATTLGTFNITPALGEALIPIFYGDGPSQFELNLRLSKTFGFGESKGGGGGGFGGHWHHGGLGGRGLSGGGGGRSIWSNPENARYNLTFSVSAHNLFNIVNLGTPVGNLGSPLFGRSNSIAGHWTQAANRRIDFQMRFSF